MSVRRLGAGGIFSALRTRRIWISAEAFEERTANAEERVAQRSNLTSLPIQKGAGSTTRTSRPRDSPPVLAQCQRL